MIEWFDDLKLGMQFKSGETTVSREDIKRFAAEFDPQPFHLDEAAAEKSAFKGLAASGWHTAAIAMNRAGRPLPGAADPPVRAASAARHGGRRSPLDEAGAAG